MGGHRSDSCRSLSAKMHFFLQQRLARGDFARQQLYRIYVGEAPQSAGRRVSAELRNAGHVQACVGHL